MRELVTLLNCFMFRDGRFDDKSLNSHFQRIYRPHSIEEENDKLTLPRISVSTDDGKMASLASEENDR